MTRRGIRVRSPARRGEPGQATVELALCLPLVCVLLLGVVQVAVVVRDQLAVQLAAREGARAAAASADPYGAARRAADAAVRLRPLTTAVVVGPTSVTVTVGYVEHTDAAFIGALLPDVHLTASVTMQLEPP